MTNEKMISGTTESGFQKNFTKTEVLREGLKFRENMPFVIWETELLKPP